MQPGGFSVPPFETWGPPLIAGALEFAGGERANRANERIAEENREFQARMSNTAYQRAVVDMKLAGINPMLAYMQGGASSPGGSTATIENSIGPAVSSAMHARRLVADMKQARELLDKTRFEKELVGRQGRLVEMQQESLREDIERKRAENRLGIAEANVDFTRAQALAMRSSARSSAARARMDELQIPGLENIARIEGGDVGQAGAWVRYILQMLRRR